MARASFVLRQSTFDQGSYLQYPLDTSGYSARTDNDNFLRADNLLLAPSESGFTPEEGSFEAEVIDYKVVRLRWNVNLTQTLGVTPVPYEAIISYSKYGPCQSINDGAVLREATYSDSLTHVIEDDTTWGYYTLFIRYLSTGGDDYYEPVANVKVMLPANYGSTDDLFLRVPEYYRYLDNNQATTQEFGPLYRFLSVIGWEIDRTRTLLDYMIAMKDPLVAEQEAIDTMAVDFGFALQSHELGLPRVRSLVDNLGELRRGKGTMDIVTRSFKLVSGCDVVYDLTAPTPAIKVYAQRVNLIHDPRIRSGIIGSIDGGFPSSAFGLTLDAGVVGTSQTDGTYDGGASVNPDYTGGGTGSLAGGWKTYPDANNFGSSIFERTNAEIKLKTGDVLYFSAHCNPELQDLITAVFLYTGSYAEGLPKYVTASTSTSQSGTTKYWRLEVPEGYSEYTEMNIVIRITDSVKYAVSDLDQLLLERNIIGDYFDGNSNQGAWIVDGSGSVSDYDWSGTPDASPSVYTDNYQKMQSILRQLIPRFLPVTQLVTSGTVYSNRLPTTNLKYTLSYNNIPGI